MRYILSAIQLNCDRHTSFIIETGKIWGCRNYRRDSTFIFRRDQKPFSLVCLAVCLLHSLGVQTHCASAWSADGIHETSSCRIPVSSRCRRICRAWLAPGNLVCRAWNTYFGNLDFLYIYVFLENVKNWTFPLQLQISVFLTILNIYAKLPVQNNAIKKHHFCFKSDYSLRLKIFLSYKFSL